MPEKVLHPNTGISHLNSRKGIPRYKIILYGQILDLYPAHNKINLVRSQIKPPLKDKIPYKFTSSSLHVCAVILNI